MSHIKFSSPFTKSFVHADNSLTTSFAEYLSSVNAYEHRVMLIVQNTSDTAIIQIAFDGGASGTGLELQPNQSCTMENYNGSVWIKSDTPATNAHIAYALV